MSNQVNVASLHLLSHTGMMSPNTTTVRGHAVPPQCAPHGYDVTGEGRPCTLLHSHIQSSYLQLLWWHSPPATPTTSEQPAAKQDDLWQPLLFYAGFDLLAKAIPLRMGMVASGDPAAHAGAQGATCAARAASHALVAATSFSDTAAKHLSPFSFSTAAKSM